MHSLAVGLCYNSSARDSGTQYGVYLAGHSGGVSACAPVQCNDRRGDPQEVEGPDFPGETFRVLKEKELRQYGEYRTRRLVLEAFSPSPPLPPSPARGQGGSVGRAEED